MPRSFISVSRLGFQPPKLPAPWQRTSLANRLLIVGFLFALLVPMVGVIAGKAATLPSENRLPAAPPKWGETFTKDFDAYYADRTGGRRALLRLRNRTLLDAFGESPAAAVILGNDDWLYLNTGLDPLQRNGFTEPDVAAAAAALRKRAAWCEAHGMRYVVQIARDKHRVYPQHLPERIRKALPADFVPQLQAACPEVTILDPLPALCAEAQFQDVFYHKDTHWNTTGALVAYRQMTEHLESTLPGYHGKTRSRFTAAADYKQAGDLAIMAGYPTRLQGEAIVWQHQPDEHVVDHPVAEIELLTDATRLKYLKPQSRTSPAGNQLHVLLLHDSFGSQYRDYLAGDVARFTAIGVYGLPKDAVAKLTPHVVIQQFVERIVYKNLLKVFDADN